METRVALLAILVKDASHVDTLNQLLHEYGPFIIGRMGIPYREKGIHIISIAMDAPLDCINALAECSCTSSGTHRVSMNSAASCNHNVIAKFFHNIFDVTLRSTTTGHREGGLDVLHRSKHLQTAIHKGIHHHRELAVR